jgi:hypothetical protein
MRTLRAALASNTAELKPFACTDWPFRLFGYPKQVYASAETAVRFQPFRMYGLGRFARTTHPETAVRFRPYYTEGS